MRLRRGFVVVKFIDNIKNINYNCGNKKLNTVGGAVFYRICAVLPQRNFETVSVQRCKQDKAPADFARAHTRKYATERKRKGNAVLRSIYAVKIQLRLYPLNRQHNC